MASLSPTSATIPPSTDQKRQVAAYLAENEAKGAPVHTFNPDAPPAEKAAQAAKASVALESIAKQTNGATGLKLATSTTPAIPTVTIEDVDGKPETSPAVSSPANKVVDAISDGADGMPGQLPAGPAPAIPDWYKIGWRAVSGIDDVPEGEEYDRGILSQFIAEQYCGEWYHNAAVIVVAVIFTHFLTLFRFGWGWIFILLAFCATYYSTSVERFRRRARDDIQRELTKVALAEETETAAWLNTFLQRFWLIYEPVLSKTIVASVDQVLSSSTPAFLDSIRMTNFSLGTKAPHIDDVRTHTETADDEVIMEWGFSFTPNDISDITPRQLAKKTNPKIVLEVRLGKGLTAGMPILLEDITCKGVMKVRLKLMTAFPHIQIVDLSFTEKPFIDYVLKPIGGETFGFDIASIPGLSSFIRDMVHATLGPMMYAPNVFTLNLAQLMSGAPLDTAIGVLQVTVHSAQGLRVSKIGGGDPDPYVTIALNNAKVIEKTKWKARTRNPHWNETKFILINSLSGLLNFKLLDYNDHRKDGELGLVTWDLAQLQQDATQENIVTKVILDGKEKGEFKFDASFYPVLKPTVVDGKAEPIPETSVGIVRLVLHQAKELSANASLTKDINPYAKVYINKDELIHSTPIIKHSFSPVWESPKEFLCADRKHCTVTVKVIDDRDFLKDPVIGYATIKLDELLNATDSQGAMRDWWPLVGGQSGRIRMSAQWKPLDMAGSLHGAGSYQPPIGIVRLFIKNAEDVKNVEGALGGKSDPYVRVMVQNTIMARTEVQNNNLNPVWEQFIYIPVHSLRESMFLECMDYQHLTKDRPLGTVEINVSELAAISEDPKYPFKSLGVHEKSQPLRVDANTFKGTLHYTAEFVPALNIKGVTFGKQKNAMQRILDDGEGYATEGDEGSSSDEEFQKVPDGITTTRNDADIASPTSIKTKPGNGSLPATPVRGAPALTRKTSSSAESGISITKEELLKHQSGIIVLDIVSGSLAKKSRLEVLMDDGYWPVFSTTRARSLSAQWDMVGEGFIKELDFGRVWLRLNENDEGDKDDIIAEYKVDAKTFLEKALDGPTKFLLTDINEENKSYVTIAAKFVPVPIILSARESINNQGQLRVEIVDGADLHGADRRGTSDPYVVLSLNGQKVHRTEVIKKTLAPVWNEDAVVQVPSRVGSEFKVEVYDWNQIEKHELIGVGYIDLEQLDTFTHTEKIVTLTSNKHGQKGQIRLNVVFTPEIIAKSRQKTSTFSAAGRAMTTIGSAPVGVGKGVISGVGTVGKGVKGIFKRDKESKDRVEIVEPPATQVSTPLNVPRTSTSQYNPSPLGQPDGYSVGNSSQTNFPARPMSPNSINQLTKEPGTLKVEIVGAKDVVDSDGDAVKPYVVVSLGDKEFKTKHVSKTNTPSWNESFTFIAGPDNKTLHIELFDHKTFGKDPHIGECDIDIWQHLQPAANKPVVAALVTSEIRQGTGQIQIRLEFEMGTGRRDRSGSGSVHSDRGLVGSPSRFSLRPGKQ